GGAVAPGGGPAAAAARGDAVESSGEGAAAAGPPAEAARRRADDRPAGRLRSAARLAVTFHDSGRGRRRGGRGGPGRPLVGRGRASAASSRPSTPARNR